MTAARRVERERTPHDTTHTTDPDWPLALGVNEAGQAVHVCVDCGAEIPDGVCVDREDGRVVAWNPGGTDPATGEPIRTIVHSCDEPRNG